MITFSFPAVRIKLIVLLAILRSKITVSEESENFIGRTDGCFRLTHPATSPYELSEDEFEDIGIQMIINCPGWPPATMLQVTGNGARLQDVSLNGWGADMYELPVITRVRGRSTWVFSLLRAGRTPQSEPTHSGDGGDGADAAERASVTLTFSRLFDAALVVPFPPPPPARFAFRRGVGPFFTCRVDEVPRFTPFWSNILTPAIDCVAPRGRLPAPDRRPRPPPDPHPPGSSRRPPRRHARLLRRHRRPRPGPP